ncbi:3907_t:CDS:2, partial [Ambispora gerdemannii]
IGLDKIGLVLYSADAISRLTDIQVQNIIKFYTDELVKSQRSRHSEKLISKISVLDDSSDFNSEFSDSDENSHDEINKEVKALLEIKINALSEKSNNLTYNHAYF